MLNFVEKLNTKALVLNSLQLVFLAVTIFLCGKFPIALVKQTHVLTPIIVFFLAMSVNIFILFGHFLKCLNGKDVFSKGYSYSFLFFTLCHIAVAYVYLNF